MGGNKGQRRLIFPVWNPEQRSKKKKASLFTCVSTCNEFAMKKGWQTSKQRATIAHNNKTLR